LISADPIREPSRKSVLCRIGEVTTSQVNSTIEARVNNIVNVIPHIRNPFYILIAWLQNPTWYKEC